MKIFCTAVIYLIERHILYPLSCYTQPLSDRAHFDSQLYGSDNNLAKYTMSKSIKDNL